MGFIRLLLAITVVIAHSNPFLGLSFIGGQLAVEVFFIISGFYMSLILNEKYHQTENRKHFIGNRLLKIFPIYWVILILSLIYELIVVYFHIDTKPISLISHSQVNLNLFSITTFILTNIFVLGQDILLFFGLNIQNGHFFFTSNFRLFDPPLYDFVLIPQAWTLSLELMFYFLAPFFTKLKNKFLFLLISLSLIIRFVLYHFGLDHDPWTYRFFPTELIYFILGIVTYRIYKFIQPLKLNTRLLWTCYSVYILFIIFFQFVPHQRIKMILLFSLTVFLLPFVFRLTKNIKIDRFLGELSYPIYISHFLIINLLTHFTSIDHNLLGIVASIVSIFISILIFQFIMKPIDHYRQQKLTASSNV